MQVVQVVVYGILGDARVCHFCDCGCESSDVRAELEVRARGRRIDAVCRPVGLARPLPRESPNARSKALAPIEQRELPTRRALSDNTLIGYWRGVSPRRLATSPLTAVTRRAQPTVSPGWLEPSRAPRATSPAMRRRSMNSRAAMAHAASAGRALRTRGS